jgi:hypothetical protein
MNSKKKEKEKQRPTNNIGHQPLVANVCGLDFPFPHRFTFPIYVKSRGENNFWDTFERGVFVEELCGWGVKRVCSFDRGGSCP